MIENKQYSDDPLINNKLYDLYLEIVKQKAIRNDNNDLIPDHVFEAPLNSYNKPGMGRVLQEAEGSKTVIKKL